MTGKNITKFIIVWFVFILIFLANAVYKDIRINKLFNYSSIPKNIQKEETFIKDENTISTYNIAFTATDDYLGAVVVLLKNIYRNEGRVTFKIREEGSEQWLHTNNYDYNYFKKLNKYILGFPVIENSKGIRYEVNLSFIDSHSDEFLDIFDEKIKHPLKAKYVFPKKIVFDDFPKIISIIKHRAAASLQDVDFLRVFLVIFAVNVGVYFVSTSAVFEKKKNDKKSLYLYVSRLIKPQYVSYFMGAAFLITLLIPILVVTNRFSLAEKAANYIWILLFLGLAWFVVSSFLLKTVNNIVEKLKKLFIDYEKIIQSSYSKITIPILAFLLILVSGLKRTYILGGDDSRLFFLYPQEFFVNFSSKIVSDLSISNIGIFIPPGSTASFTITMLLLKTILGPLNIQSILYMANMIGGFVAFFWLSGWLYPVKGKYAKLIKIIASYMYIFSIFNIYTLYNSKLLAIFLVSLFPLTLYLILRAIVEKRVYLITLSSLIFSVFCIPTLAAPWYLSAMLSIMPLVVYVLKNHKLSAVKYVLILVFSFIILNFHWLIYLPDTGYVQSDANIHKGSFISQDFREQNERGIRTVSEINSVLYPILNLYHENIQRDFNWSYYSIFASWYTRILPFNLIFFASIISAGFLIKSKKYVGLFVSFSFSFLLAVYFYTVNITRWGIDVFSWMNNYIPGFVMFRNMYDKFAFSVAFTFAILLYISMCVLVNTVKREKIIKYLLYSLAVVTFLNSLPFLLGKFDKKPLWTTANTYNDTTAFNNEFLDMMKYIEKNPNPGKYISLPLTSGNAFPVQDIHKPNHYYNGVSPVLVISGKNDFSGLLSFGQYDNQVARMIKERKYDDLGNILRKFNIKYAIVNHTITPDLQSSFVYSEGIYFHQDEEFMDNILGEKIKDFGEKYSLYEISSRYQSEKIFLSKDIDEVFAETYPVVYEKVASHEYDIVLNVADGFDRLVFLDHYLKGWELYSSEGRVLDFKHSSVLGYANSWHLEFDDFENTEVRVENDKKYVYLKLYYKPYNHYRVSLALSSLGYVGLGAYTLVSICKRRRK